MRFDVRSCAVALIVLASACSDSAPSPAGTAIGTTGAGGSAPGGSGGSNPGPGSGVTTGSGSPGSTDGSGGSLGSTGGTGGSGGAAGMGSGGSPIPDASTTGGGGGGAVAPEAGAGGSPKSDAGEGGSSQSFACSLIIGCFQTSQWFDAGFETALGTAKWEIKWEHNTFTERWASPTDAFWNIATVSPCANNATAPDRVLFISYSMTLATEAAWETALTRVVDNIKTKFPSAKQIELLGMVRAPNNQTCPGNSNMSTIVRPEEDQAMQAVADKSGGAVLVGPKYFAPSCDSFITNNTTLTAAAASAIGPTLAASYK